MVDSRQNAIWSSWNGDFEMAATISVEDVAVPVSMGGIVAKSS